MKVFVSVPNTGWIHKSVCLATDRLLMDRAHDVTLIRPTWKPYEQSMNRIALDFWEGEWDYWLSVDSDNPPQRNPLELIDLNLDVVGLPTPIFHNAEPGWPICWNAFDAVEDGYNQHPPEDGKLCEVDAVGSGCILIHRRVIEGINPPWFIRETDEIGRVIHGPDFYFCQQAKGSGFHIWTHYGYPCRHYNEIELIEAMESFTCKKV